MFIECASLAGGLIRSFHLPKNLRLTENHGVQSACDAAHMANEGAVGIAVYMWYKFSGACVAVSCQPVDKNLRASGFCFAIQFGAVASG